MKRLDIFSENHNLLNDERGKDRFDHFVDPLPKRVDSVDDQFILSLWKVLVTKR
jgi:hypothetical protein